MIPLVYIQCMSLNIPKLLLNMHESQLNDKIKYWQYHLNKNKHKNTKQPYKKTPEKKASGKAFISSANTLMNTIDKLKLYLDQANKPKTSEFNAKKEKVHKKINSKDFQNQNKTSKSISMQGTMKLNKSNHQKIKIQISNNSKSKSKSRSKSKSKLIKGKKSKQIKSIKQTKQIKPIKMDKLTSPKKMSKKKKNKSSEKHPLSIKVNQIDEWELQKKLMETLNTKTQKSRNQTQSSRFRLWDQQSEVLYNLKQKSTKTISSYLQSFLTFLKFARNKKNFKAPFVQRFIHSPFNLSTMIRSQESKMLELRHQLSRLKDSNNLNESLQLIISKVNENISSLKKIEYSQKEQNKMTTALYKQHEHEIGSFHDSNKSVKQSNKSSFSQPPQIREPILLIDSLNISQDQLNKKLQSKYSQDNLKQQSSINLLDSKFLNVTINNPIELHGPESSNEHENVSLMKLHSPVLTNLQNSSTLLLSASAKSQSKLLSGIVQEDQNPFQMQFTINQVKFTPKEQQIDDDDNLYTEQQNTRLLKSINTILNGHQLELQMQRKQSFGSRQNVSSKLNYYPSQQKHQICILIVNDLILQIIPFLATHQSLLQKLIEIFPSEENQPNQQQLTPIQYTNQYLLDLTDKLLSFAVRQFNFFERLSCPLGVEPFVNLRYIRISLLQEYMLGGFEPYNEQNYEKSIEKQMQQVSEKAQIFSKEYFDEFDDKIGNQTILYQVILNRCLYEAINNILDKFRPFGTNGLPVFYQQNKNYRIPSLDLLKKNLKCQLRKYLNIRLGLQITVNQTAFQTQKEISQALKANTILLRDEIENDFQTQDQDSMERYELMLMIENYIFSQQSWVINKTLQRNI